MTMSNKTQGLYYKLRTVIAEGGKKRRNSPELVE